MTQGAVSRHSAGPGREERGARRPPYEDPPTKPRRKRVVLADSRAPVTRLRTVVELEEQTSYGEELVRQLIRAQLARRSSCGRRGRWRSSSPCPRCSSSSRSCPRSTVAGVAAAVAGARARPLPVVVRRRLLVQPQGRATGTRLRRDGGEVARNRSRTGGRKDLGPRGGPRGHRRDLLHRLARVADGQHHTGLPGRPPHGPLPPQRRRGVRRVPVRRVVPRRRRPGAEGRRRRALVPDRLHRRLPGADAVRRRAAAPLRRLHAAGLLRGPPRLPRAAWPRRGVRGVHRDPVRGPAAAGRRAWR